MAAGGDIFRTPEAMREILGGRLTSWIIPAILAGLLLAALLALRSLRLALAKARAELAVRRGDRAAADLEQARLQLALGERMKELRLMHFAARLLQSDRPFNHGVLSTLVAQMPAAWLYPEGCEARIKYRDIEVSTEGWRHHCLAYQTAKFATSAGKGVIEVAYLVERPPAAEGPFLTEERALIDSLAEMLGAYIERDLVEQERRRVEAELRQSQKMQALGTLAGGIAHDFNNILTAIVGHLELGFSDVPEGHPVRAPLQAISRAGDRARDLVKRILLFSRKQEAERRVVTLAPVVEEAVRLLRASLPTTIQIRTTYATDAPLVLADPGQIHQIVMNLGTNAGYAMSHHGGLLSFEIDRIDVGDQPLSANLKPGIHACLSVRDTGTGMSPEVKERLFEPFFTTKGLDGTGLGLSVVHGIVRDHEGAVVVDTEIGRGTCFQIYLPEAVAVAVQPAAASTGRLAASNQHILYVDDEEEIVYLMSTIITRLGYQCSGFSNPAAALGEFRSRPDAFDAVIADLTMPEMTGLDLAARLKTIRPGLPIAIVSGYWADDAAPGDPAVTRLQKPITKDELGRALQAMLLR